MKKILRAVFLVILCLSALTSCKNEAGETIVIESETTKTTEEATEELTTLETTTEETTETTTDETEEATTEETKELTPEETAILETLTDEEKEVWLSMPDIITMRVLSRYDKEEKEFYSEFLYNEIIYIDKIGQMKKFITYDDYSSPYDDIIIAWLNDQINQNEDAELIDVVDIHKLIEFYNTFMCIDSDSKWVPNYTVGLAEEFDRHYWFKLYGIRNNSENNLETLLISEGDAGDYYLRRNNTDEGEPRDNSGRETFDLYLKLDPFMVKGGGGYGNLTGEKV